MDTGLSRVSLVLIQAMQLLTDTLHRYATAILKIIKNLYQSQIELVLHA